MIIIIYLSLSLSLSFSLSNYLRILNLAGTAGDKMYPLISPVDALRDDLSEETRNNMYLGECQDPSPLDKDSIEGNILICSYSVRFILGLSSVRRAIDTAKNLSAIGIIFYMDPFVMGFQLNPTPMEIPGLMIPSSEDSRVPVLFSLFDFLFGHLLNFAF